MVVRLTGVGGRADFCYCKICPAADILAKHTPHPFDLQIGNCCRTTTKPTISRSYFVSIPK
ncbi:hypothetical protein EQU24_04605 [Methylotuvimicrobium buryatense]|uniref:Uncharacterized protein n=1 Tax=Methylotuvimicrobium buryatense TaxID=95641 RepID=A0A4P9UKF0_METBY|nr:hypothetical protein EQU24_04605 [Methylotuvimicrobium buryatense]